jgi:sulfur-oxidizing protein SoxY
VVLASSSALIWNSEIGAEESGPLILLKQELIAFCGPHHGRIIGRAREAFALGDRHTCGCLCAAHAHERRTVTEGISIRTLDRREVLLGARAAAAMATFLRFTNLAQAESRGWEELVKKLIGDAKPVAGRLMLDLPEVVENGNTVPFSLLVDSPMTEQDYVKVVHVLASGNPHPVVAKIYFTPASGKASITSRMRLAKTQDVVGVAETSNGEFMVVTRTVKVTIGGCGS